ncbi:unnamed protein product, partial [Scytosiphon promiscuus]
FWKIYSYICRKTNTNQLQLTNYLKLMLMPKLLLLFLCLFLYFFNSSAQKLPEQEEKALLENLSKSAKNTQTLKASFTQEKYLDILSDKIISEGKILLKAPSKLKWVYDSPFNYIIILTEKEILINDEGKKNEINIESSKIFKQVSDLIINSVKGDLINEEKFEASFFKEGNFRIELLPIDQNIKEYFSK